MSKKYTVVVFLVICSTLGSYSAKADGKSDGGGGNEKIKLIFSGAECPADMDCSTIQKEESPKAGEILPQAQD